jgi:hypothetical protein
LAKGTRPSDHYPDYFKMDLRTGTPEEHPFARALDQTADAWFKLAHEKAFHLQPEFFDETRRDWALEGLGFVTRTLSEMERETLFHQTKLLFQERGRLSSVERLAAIYFPRDAFTIRRGRPQTGDRVRPGRFPFVVGDNVSRDQCLHLEIRVACDEARTQEFLRNAQLFIPAGYTTLISLPQPPKEADAELRLGRTLRVEPRRL